MKNMMLMEREQIRQVLRDRIHMKNSVTVINFQDVVALMHSYISNSSKGQINVELV